MTTKVLYKGNYHFCERFLKHFKTSQNCETVLHIQQNHLQGRKNVKWHSYHALVSRSLVEIYLLGSASCILTTVYSSISFVIHLYTSINHIGSWISSDNLCPSVPFATVYARLQKGEVNVVWAIAEMKTPLHAPSCMIPENRYFPEESILVSFQAWSHNTYTKIVARPLTANDVCFYWQSNRNLVPCEWSSNSRCWVNPLQSLIAEAFSV